ncbi:uncharacterized protein LOC111277594 [Durio zibethinus]|uniref:Uncharacterized protein LOC111277594 n=1 Tax=Durio zibethinus TaxID=66656 RepID=A0A6P5WVA0_DURZI|nr:uncharacterized protein LOC111277594 [Durio zibethinus]
MEQIIANDGAEEATTNTIMFPSLESIILESCSNLRSFYLGHDTVEYPCLTELTVEDCPKMVAFATSSPRAQNIKTNGIAPFFSDKVVFPNLTKLVIVGSGYWTTIWDNKLTFSSFSELTFLRVKNCESLLNIFPFHMMKRLDKLEYLEIVKCESLVEVIGLDYGLNSTESTTMFIFPKIRDLLLHWLPKLKNFYSRLHTTSWPSLKQLQVIGCDNVEILAREYLSFSETLGESQLEIISFQQPLFWVTEDTFPNLEKLFLEANDIMTEIWHGQLPTQHFCKLTYLSLQRIPNRLVTILNSFIQSLPNLETLKVEEAPLNEIFQCEGLGGEEEHPGALVRLTELFLIELPELTHLWKEEYQVGEVFSNLETLKVWKCDKLKTLVPSSVYFKHLTNLQVSNCHGLKNLLTLPTAKSLVVLTEMSITDCQMIEEIIARGSDDVMDGIVFSQLKSLELRCLPSLSSFCSGNCAFGFPSLEELIMGQCPKMEIFTTGELSTPMLQGIQSTEGEYVGHWEGNLNAIVQQLFTEKQDLHQTFMQTYQQVFPSLEDLERSSINIQRIWHKKFLATASCAQYLTCLTIEGCHNLNCLFSSSMMESFAQLKILNIENCENVEKVILIEGLAKEELMSQKLFGKLEFLLLKYLPKLTRFCHGSYLDFPSLRTVRIESCLTLDTFVSDAEGNNSEIASPTLFNEKVAFPCLKELSIIGVGNWRKIWHNEATNSGGFILQITKSSIGV